MPKRWTTKSINSSFKTIESSGPPEYENIRTINLNVLNIGDQSLNSTFINGNLIWVQIALKKWLGERISKISNYSAFKVNESVSDVWASYLVEDFKKSFILHAEECKVDFVSKTICDDFDLSFKLVGLVSSRITKGSLKEIPNVLLQELVVKHLDKMNEAYDSDRVRKLFALMKNETYLFGEKHLNNKI